MTAKGRTHLLWTLALVTVLGFGGPAQAAQPEAKVLVLAQPLARADAIWMAQAKGFFKEENLRVTVRYLSSGNDALGAFQEGQDGRPGAADFVIVNELLAVNFWQTVDGFAVIAALARDAAGYVAVAKSELKTPQDLKGKAVGTQLGSASAWFLGEYLRAHGMSEADVAVKNVTPEAIVSWDGDQGELAALFVRERYPSGALKMQGSGVHRLATAAGYIHSYLVIGTWERYLRDHPGVAERFLRALDKGRRYAEVHRADVIQFAREMFSGSEDSALVDADYSSTERVVGLDRATVDDFAALARWMREAGLVTRPFDPGSFFDPGPLRGALPERLASEFGR